LKKRLQLELQAWQRSLGQRTFQLLTGLGAYCLLDQLAQALRIVAGLGDLEKDQVDQEGMDHMAHSRTVLVVGSLVPEASILEEHHTVAFQGNLDLALGHLDPIDLGEEDLRRMVVADTLVGVEGIGIGEVPAGVAVDLVAQLKAEFELELGESQSAKYNCQYMDIKTIKF
jgi:hypothetical protein